MIQKLYDLSRSGRTKLAADITTDILSDLRKLELKNIITYFENEDTYARKLAYLSIGKIFFTDKNLKLKVIQVLINFYRITIQNTPNNYKRCGRNW